MILNAKVNDQNQVKKFKNSYCSHFLTDLSWQFNHGHDTKKNTNSRRVEAKTTAKIFVHGWTSGKTAESPLARAAVTQKKAQLALTVTVTKKEKIKTSDTLRQKKRPLIFLIFKNNRTGEKQDIIWLHQVMLLLKKDYGLENYNAVA